MARSPIDTSPKRWRRSEDAAAALLLVVVLVGCFAPALGLPFRNADDFLHLDVAWALLGGEPGALEAMVRGYGRSDVLRLAPWAAWTLDAAIFGWNAAGYYATNTALQVGLSLAAYALARRLGAGPWGALAGGAWVGLNVATGQGVYFLGSRDDQLAVLMAVTLVAAWPGLHPSGWGRALAVALLAAACLSKPPAAIALLLLWVVERGAGSERSQLAARAAVGATVLLYGAVLLALVGGSGLREMAAAPAVEGRWSDPELLRRMAAMVAPGWSVRLPGRGLWAQLVPGAMVLGAGVLAMVTRQGAVRAARVGAIWLVLTVPMPVLWLSSRLGQGEDSGRQWLLPSVGLGLIVAAAVPRRGRLALPVALAILTACAVRYSGNAAPFLDRPDPTVQRFVSAVQGRGESPLVVALQRPHAGVSALLTSGALRRAGGLKEPPRVMLQGSERSFGVRWEALGYGALEADGEPFALGRFEGSLLTDGPVGDPGAFAEHRGSDPGRPGRPLRSWRLDREEGGWSAWPPRAPGVDYRPGRGFVVTGGRVLPEGQVGPVLGGGEQPTALLSPELALDPHSVCGLQLDLEGSPTRPGWRSMGAELVPGGVFSLVTWSEAADFADGYRRSLTVPWGSDARLDNAPAWRATDWVRRIAIMPANAPGPVVVRGVTLLACEAG